MAEQVVLALVSGAREFAQARVRYAFLDRVRRSVDATGCAWWAFGIENGQVRLVFDGDPAATRECLRRVRIGTALDGGERSAPITFADPEVSAEEDVERAVAWAHRVGVGRGSGPLATPWTSHRDLLGYRVAPFFDAAQVRRRVDVARVHRLAGGRRVPEPEASRASVGCALDVLLRVAAAVRGVLPADRRCFRLFVHLGLALGWGRRAVASALALTPRRIRQLASEAEDHLPIALASVADARLSVVP